MKDASMQKVSSVPSCLADSSEALPKLSAKTTDGVIAFSEGSRRVRRSATMIGLAISMSATSLLLGNHNKAAIATEAIASEPILTNPQEASPSEVATESSSSAKAEASGAVKPAPPAIKHEVKQGESLWQLSQDYQVAPETIAASNDIAPQANLLIGQKIKIPSVNSTLTNVSNNQRTEKLSGTEAAPTALNNSLSHLRETRNRLQDSLTQLRTQEPLLRSDRSAILEGVSIVDQAQTNLGKQPQVTVLAPEFNETNAIEIPVPAPETEFSPSTGQSPSATLDQPIPIPVSSPEAQVNETLELGANQAESAPVSKVTANAESTTSPTPQRQVSDSLDYPVPIPIAPTATAAVGNNNPKITSETTARIQSPVEVPVPLKPATAPASSNQAYQVKPGDTLNTIARHHGLSVTELIRANNIRNPNLIKVNQHLIIPQSVNPSVAQETSPVTVGTPSRDNLSSAVETATSQTLSAPASPLVASVNSQQTIEIPVEAPSATYTEKLKEEVVQLQQTYRYERSSSQTVSVTANPSSPQAVNPEWASDRQLPNQPSIGSQNVQTAQASAARASRTPTWQTSRPPSQLVGAAPVESGAYNPMLQTPVGETVAPDLPPLADPEQYLPNVPARFNGYIWPTRGVITSGYGRRWGRMHRGIDIAAPIGTPIVAAASGEVVYAGWNSGGYGNLVKVKHPDGSLTLYAHNNRILVRSGQAVEQGQQISEMGSTGYSTGPHLHFEVHPTGQAAVNPIAFLPKERS